jgi:predicted permease
MPILSRLGGLLLRLAGRDPARRDLDAEVAGYFDMLVDEKISTGMSPAEARRQARLEMDGVDQVKESVRAARPAAWLDTIVRDVRYSLRLLAKTPAFSLTAVLVLALGIGANAAVFSAINVLWFKPVPGSEQPGQVVGVYDHDPTTPDSYRPFSYADFEELRDRAGVFDHVMAHRSFRVGLTEGETSRRTKAALATGDYFSTLGVRLAAGRSFTRDEERPGSRATVAVLSHPYWQRLGSPGDILGRTILVNARPFTVVGIAPAGFAGPMAVAGPEFWMPLGAAALLPGEPGPWQAPGLPDAASRELMVIGRLKPDVTAEGANAAMRALSAALAQARPQKDARRVIMVSRLSRFQQGNSPTDDDREGVLGMGALMGAALIVLVVASLNVANMQLARGSSRRREIAMRLALGAGRGRIVGQLMTEGLILALAGSALGLVAGVWTLRAAAASFTAIVPQAFYADVTPDWRVTLASLAFCTLSAIAFGLGPSWKLSRLDLLPEMKRHDGGEAGGGLHRFGTRNLLVAAQIALSLALLAASGLFVRAGMAAARADPGYRFDRQLLLRVDAATAGLDEVSGRQAYRQLIARLRSTPGVESAAMASLVAFGNDSFGRRVRRVGAATAAVPGDGRGVIAQSYDVGAAYFGTLGLPMLRGREFTMAEELDPTTSPVAIIDEPLAIALFSGEDPLGQFIQYAAGAPGTFAPPAQVVGVAPGLRHSLTDPAPVPHVYLPLGSRYRALLNVHVRTADAGPSDAGDARRALWNTTRTADARLALLSVQTLEEARDAMPMNWLVRSAARTFGAFGAIALFMAAVGLYGVKAYLVAQRTREIGIRLAIGAGAGDVIRMVLKEGAVMLVVSVGVGLLLAVGLGRAVGSLLVGVQPFDPLVLSVAAFVLTAAVLVACYVPARRATRVSPVTALRVE